MSTTASETKVIPRAHAFNEMGILEREGRQGYHLIGFGLLTLALEPSDHLWEHLRLLAASPSALLALQEAGWVVVGTWGLFTYLKRQSPAPVST